MAMVSHVKGDGSVSKTIPLVDDIFSHSLADLVGLKVGRFLDQMDGNYPKNLHEIILMPVEKVLFTLVLERTGGNQMQASDILGISRNTLRKKIGMHGIVVLKQH